MSINTIKQYNLFYVGNEGGGYPISLIDCKPEYQGQSRRGEEEIAFHFLADSFLVSKYSKTRSK